MFIKVDDAQLFTVSFGSAPRAFVAIGGWAGSWELWTEPFSLLSRTWRTVAYDHRGTGATLAPPESITVDRMVADLFAILDTLEIQHCVLGAESAGVLVALQAVLQHPERFTGLVLVDGLYYHPVPAEREPFVLGLEHQFEATIARFVDTCLTAADGEAVRRWGRQILMRSPQAAAIRLYECIYGIDLRPQLSQITQPTLVIHGESDQLVPLAAAQWLADQLPNSHLHVVKGAGHVPTVTHAAEVAGAINDYFALIK